MNRYMALHCGDLQSTEPTLLLCLRPAAMQVCPWFVELQRAYIAQHRITSMLLSVPVRRRSRVTYDLGEVDL